MFVNWGIEARKWQVLVSLLQRISFFKAFKAVFTGQSLAVNTPNRIGEYVGRVVYLDDGNRLKGIALTIVGSMSQTIITLVAGIVSLIIAKNFILDEMHHMEGLSSLWLDGLLYMVLFGTVAMVVIYYKLSWLTRLFEKLPLVKKYSYLIEKLEDFHWRELTRILSLSLSRYVVFLVQFILLLQVFGVEAPVWQSACIVSVFYLVLAVVPTISSAELGLRSFAAVQLFSILSANKLGILYTAAGIWLINLIIPALFGSLFVLGIKLFKK